jgi:alkylhydroperoxidase/carboxymuconolactone decarboxylase family protein YurZ
MHEIAAPREHPPSGSPGHSFGTKALFAFIHLVTRQPTPEIIKLISHCSEFFGAYTKKVTQEAMRGPSTWSVEGRELMAASVLCVNACEFCLKAHTAVAVRA